MERQHFLALDGLRGVAALLVMGHHIGLLSGHPEIAPLGFLAVDLFFVLSGFVIAYSYEPRFAAGYPVRTFLVARLIRLYPLIFIGLVLGAAWSLTVGDHAFSAASSINFLLLPVLVGAVTFPFDVPVWSLFFEVVANVAHVAVLGRLSSRLLLALALACGLALFAAIVHFATPSLGWEPRTFLAGFARVGWSYIVGILFYRWIKGRELRPSKLPLLLPFAVLIVALHGPPPPVWMIARGAIDIFLILPAIVWAALHLRPTGRWASVMAWLGRLSFPLYAIHLPIVTFAARFIVNRPDGSQLWWWALFVFVIIAAALALERRVDLPVRRRLGRHLIDAEGTSCRAPG